MRDRDRYRLTVALVVAGLWLRPPAGQAQQTAPTSSTVSSSTVSSSTVSSPTAATPAQAPSEKPLLAPATHTEQMPPDRAEGILGAPVLGPDGKDIGRIIDVLVDSGGRPRAAVIDFGGFFGVGNRKVAVSWTNLNFSPAAKSGPGISLDLTVDQIKGAPEYHDTTAAAVVSARKPDTLPAPLPDATPMAKPVAAAPPVPPKVPPPAPSGNK